MATTDDYEVRYRAFRALGFEIDQSHYLTRKGLLREWTNFGRPLLRIGGVQYV